MSSFLGNTWFAMFSLFKPFLVTLLLRYQDHTVAITVATEEPTRYNWS
ncbi:gp76 [Listeria phage P100]|uniref:Gp76 n=1 Tax=Listeria phage P100 TaxID=2908172 RepID=Q30L69_9CAUD|nr:gp76 [Listeria phage P100]AAY53379.1 gp76 [Listeria phage P100]